MKVKTRLLAALTLTLVGCMSAVAIQPINVGNDAHIDPESIITVKAERSIAEGFQCFEPYLWAATLGLVPIHCINTYHATASNGTGEEQRLGTYKVTSWVGWVAYPIAAFPGWYLDASYGGPSAFVEGFLKKQHEAQQALPADRYRPVADARR